MKMLRRRGIVCQEWPELITEYLDQHDEVVITARTVAVLTEGPK